MKQFMKKVSTQADRGRWGNSAEAIALGALRGVPVGAWRFLDRQRQARKRVVGQVREILSPAAGESREW